MQKFIKIYKSNLHLVFSMLFVFLAFLFFYPQRYSTIDEHDYLNNAQLILQGNLKTDCNLMIPGQWQTNLGYCISKYNIGTSLFLIPLIIIDRDLVFLTTLLIFILSIFIFYKILDFYNFDKKLIYFFALFPHFIFFSRTLLSEIYSMLLILLVFYCFLNFNKNLYRILGALFITIAILVRYTNIIPLLVMGLYFLYYFAKDIGLLNAFKKYYLFSTFLLIGLALIMYFNFRFYGSVFRSGYYFSSEEGNFVINQIPKVLIGYLVLTNIFYPFAFIQLLKSKVKHSLLFLLVFLSVMIFYVFTKNESFPGKSSDLVLGLRFLIPVYPFLLISYFYKIDTFKQKRHYNILLSFFIFALALLTIVISVIHFLYTIQ